MQEAYAAGWIKHEELWLDMLYDRNQTSHTYDNEIAQLIYSHLKKYTVELRAVYDYLKNHVINTLPK